MIKKTVKQVISSSILLSRFLGMIAGDHPRVLCYHRFSPPGAVNGQKVSANVFRRQLEMIAEKFRVLTLGECIAYYARNGRWPGKTAVITIDDGYRDFYQYAYPELKRLSLPATFFVTVNFVKKKSLLWHDRLRWAIENTVEKSFQVTLGERRERILLNNAPEKRAAWKRLSDFCISIDDQAKWELIASVESALEITPPDVAPEDYEPATWDEIREMSRNGIEIGSHTLNHPVLSRIPPIRLNDEIVGSKHVLEEILSQPVRTFCYPNGMPSDINEEVVSTVKKAGYLGAPLGMDYRTWEPYRIPRIGVSRDMKDFIWKLHGGEAVYQRMYGMSNGKDNP